MKPPDKPLSRRAFTVAEVAAQLGCAVDSVYRAIHRGQLRPMAGFGRYMISDAELQRFLAATK